jgi:hypothetical protein
MSDAHGRGAEPRKVLGLETAAGNRLAISLHIVP